MYEYLRNAVPSPCGTTHLAPTFAPGDTTTAQSKPDVPIGDTTTPGAPPGDSTPAPASTAVITPAHSPKDEKFEHYKTFFNTK